MLSKLRLRAVFLLLLLISTVSLGISNDKVNPLLVDKVFALSAKMHDSQTVILQWKIAKGYYLYKDRIKMFSVAGSKVKFAPPLWPNSEWRQDEGQGKYSAYAGDIFIPLPIITAPNNKIEFIVYYQGCSAQGFCYPPQAQKVLLNKSQLGIAATITEIKSPDLIMFKPKLKDDTSDAGDTSNASGGGSLGKIKSLKQLFDTTQPASADSLEKVLQTAGHWWVGIIFLGLGVLLSLTPCVLPMLPILLGILAGSAKGGASTLRRVLLSLCYVLGMALSYALIGLLFGSLGGNVQLWMQQPLVLILMGMLFAALAISLFGFYDIKLPSAWQGKLQSINSGQRKGSFFGALILGCVASLVASPCVTPPLVATLAFISQQGSPWWGAYILFMMGLGMGVPLLIIGFLGAKFMPRSGAWMVAIKTALGFLLLAVTLLLWQRILPTSLVMLLWALWCWIITISIFVSYRRYAMPVFARIISIVLAVLFLVAGVWSAKCAWHGQVTLSWNKPLQAQVMKNIIEVHGLKDMKNKLAVAKQQNRPVLIDFYADWCVSCHLFARRVMSKAEVQQALKDFIVLHADITANSDSDKKLMHSFGVIAPPTFIFYSAKGKVLSQYTIIGGEISAADFIKVLTKVRNSAGS